MTDAIPIRRLLDIVMVECLANEQSPDKIIVEGLTVKFAFERSRIEQQKENIAKMCNQLPDKFQKKMGGGWSFLNLCQTKDGVQWGEHVDCEQLVALAIASGQGEFLMPREMWSLFPGGVPYIVFDTMNNK